jgi:hypothetical protein
MAHSKERKASYLRNLSPPLKWQNSGLVDDLSTYAA